MQTKLDRAQGAVRNNMYWAMGVGAIPFPIVDIVAVTAVQLDMIKRLCNIYGVNYSENSGKSTISAIATSTLSRIGANIVKGIPFLGQIIGGFSMSILSGASTYAIGQAFISHFENGGNMENFDKEAGKEKYETEFYKGTQEAKDIEKINKEPQSKAEIFEMLDSLVKLKKNGAITETEFNEKKKELLNKI